MNAADDAIAQRMPVWLALSELFLDTELDEADRERIASALAASPYSEDKLEQILRFELAPVLGCNLLSVAGEWQGFEADWLRARLAPRLDRRPWIRWPLFPLLSGPWRTIRARVRALRATGPPQATSGSASADARP